jgi:hypothetical protein
MSENKKYFKRHPITLAWELKKHYGKDVKIGTGSGFFYCGACDENTLSTLEKISANYYQSLITRDCMIYHKIYILPSVWDEKRRRIEKDLKAKGFSDDYIKGEIEKTYPQQEDDFRYKLAYQKRIEKEIDEFTSFHTRKVVDRYQAVDYVKDISDCYDCTVILFEGGEKAPYWSRQEYLIGVNKEDSDFDKEEEELNGCRSD